MKTPQRYCNSELELEVNGHVYYVDVTAYGTYTFIKGRRYLSNGDPGYPDEEDFEIDEVNATWTDQDGKVVEETPEMYDALEQYLLDNADWEDDECEPDYDAYEAAAVERYERDCARCGV